MSGESLCLIDSFRPDLGDAVSKRLGDFHVEFYQMRHGLSDGVRVLRIHGIGWSSTWIPTRGMGLAEVHLGKFRFGWQSPVRGPVHPHWVPLMEPSGLGWLDGFDELLVRCGISSNGAPQFADNGRLELPLHGRIANLPATTLELDLDGEGNLVVFSQVVESRFHFDKWLLQSTMRLSPRQARIEIRDQVSNLSAQTRESQMLYHFNIGQPLLDEGSRVHVPCERVVPRNPLSAANIDSWPTVAAPKAGSAEQVYFCKPIADSDGKSTAVLRNADQTHAARIDFGVASLPYFNLWKNSAAPEDGYVVGMEPATNFPNPKRFESQHGRTVSLPADGSVTYELTLAFSDRASEVVEWCNRVDEIQRQTTCALAPAPLADWCE
jgi:hypothetical protein